MSAIRPSLAKRLGRPPAVEKNSISSPSTSPYQQAVGALPPTDKPIMKVPPQSPVIGSRSSGSKSKWSLNETTTTTSSSSSSPIPTLTRKQQQSVETTMLFTNNQMPLLQSSPDIFSTWSMMDTEDSSNDASFETEDRIISKLNEANPESWITSPHNYSCTIAPGWQPPLLPALPDKDPSLDPQKLKSCHWAPEATKPVHEPKSDMAVQMSLDAIDGTTTPLAAADVLYFPALEMSIVNENDGSASNDTSDAGCTCLQQQTELLCKLKTSRRGKQQQQQQSFNCLLVCAQDAFCVWDKLIECNTCAQNKDQEVLVLAVMCIRVLLSQIRHANWTSGDDDRDSVDSFNNRPQSGASPQLEISSDALRLQIRFGEYEVVGADKLEMLDVLRSSILRKIETTLMSLTDILERRKTA
ncbi:hypothetical protein EYB25_006383 [Talaromyces marneffei]|nr:hypothetical protein EYB25_006383 [Talaromyces marneffei]